MMDANKATYYVEHKGHRWATCAVPFSGDKDAAVAEARRSCVDAMRTDVIEIPAGAYSGNVILSLGRNGKAVP